MSVEVEGLSLTETAALYGVSKGWVSKLVGRYRTEGEAAFEPRSRRPHSSPSRVAEVVNETIVNLRVDLAERGLDAGPETIQWHLAQAGHDVSVSTIRRRLIAAGLVTPEPKKRDRERVARLGAVEFERGNAGLDHLDHKWLVTHRTLLRPGRPWGPNGSIN